MSTSDIIISINGADLNATAFFDAAVAVQKNDAALIAAGYLQKPFYTRLFNRLSGKLNHDKTEISYTRPVTSLAVKAKTMNESVSQICALEGELKGHLHAAAKAHFSHPGAHTPRICIKRGNILYGDTTIAIPLKIKLTFPIGASTAL